MSNFTTIGKSKQFYDFLKNEILSGEYKTGDKFPSIRDLAAKYGISSITVNSVISNLVNEGLLYVEQGRGTFVAERKQLNRNAKKMIGVMFFDFSMENNVEAGIFSSIQENLTEDYYVIPYNSYDKLDLFYKGLKGLSELGVDGLILIPPTSEDYDPQTVKTLIGRDIPIVFINRIIPSIKADFFTTDFEDANYIAAKQLINSGRKNIALLTSNSASLTEHIKKGYIRAHEEFGVKYDPNMLIEWHKGLDSAKAKLAAILDNIDGLIGSDLIIYRLRKAIYGSGRAIPGDLAIIGINDTVYSRFMKPSLTAVPFASKDIGKEASKAIISRIETDRDEDINKAFKTDIIFREST